MSTKNDARQINLQDCAAEPIQIPGAIQPHGMLLVVAPDFQILQASLNTPGSSGKSSASPLPGKPLSQFLGEKNFRLLQAKLDSINIDDRLFHLGSISIPWQDDPAHPFDVLAHRHDNLLIIELESIEHYSDVEDFPSRVIDFIISLESKPRPEEISDIAAREVRRLSGFDRVLIYQFDVDWHGNVIAESRNDNLPAYLGHRFPASDIPAQARELYRTNRSRLIRDAAYIPVPISPAENPVTKRALDMSYCALRSVSPVHVEYMRNMGTAASMSFSIVRDGRLWGLISCHHVAPRWVSYSIRRACELVAQVLALQLAAAERQAMVEQRLQLRQYVSRLLASMAETDDFVTGLLKNPDDLLSVAGAAGAAVITRESCQMIGQSPSESDVREIAAWLAEHHADRKIIRINNLVAEFPPAERFKNIASGLLAASVSSFAGSYVMWFRPEVVQTVVWAGDPYKVPVHSKDGKIPARLNPRTSFAAWTEVVRGSAHPWSDAEVESVTELNAEAVGIVLRKAEAMAALSAELQRSNRELEAFSYSVSHDLRAPFRHITGYAELIRDYESSNLSERGKRYASIVIEAARDAGRLIDNLLSFSQMGRSTMQPMNIDLNQLVRETQADVMETEGAQRAIKWEVQPLPRTYGDLPMMRLAVRNFLSNAVKYTRDKGDTAHIVVRGHEDKNEITFEVQDNGVGFDMQYSDKLFGVFQRLHRMEEFAGTGIGLANVRRIVERHGGRVWASGEPGQGATFGFSIPKQQVSG
ncbi:MAG TPA: ATP-binding protein [Tepidisphaeraceae bacterium]|jgi:light-regulated signal transduction histidine kinase (bacteriophytochrome)